jgi:hypothetical protein
MIPAIPMKIKEGDLVKISSYAGWTICLPIGEGAKSKMLIDKFLKERLLTHVNSSRYRGDNEKYEDLEGSFALVTRVVKNKIDQPTAYEVMIAGRTMRCKGVVAERYFKVVGNDQKYPEATGGN